MSTGPHEIYKITLDIWDNAYCGSNYGPYIEIISGGGEKRHTYFHGPFSSGTTLIWDNKGENRYGGNNLGELSGFQVTPFPDSYHRPKDYYIMFQIVGGGGDDFCPKTLTIYTNDGTKYKKSGMKDWADDKFSGWRKAWA